MSILDEIVAHKRQELVRWKQAFSLEQMCARGRDAEPPPSFMSAIRSRPVGVIAEVKRRSPSKGPIRPDLQPEDMATDYEQGGAQAVSCLMDARYFGGGPEDFHRVRGATVLPLLYKEFVIDPWQVWQAKSLGASVVLLIVAALPSRELRDLLATVKEAGLMHLVEVHSEEELRKAADSGAECIGVNNRDLRTFEVSLETSFRLAAHAPDNCTLISESGIWTAEDVAQLHKHGFQGILVGEHLLKQTDIVQAVQDLMARVW